MSSGGNNATISEPGPHWQMLWPDSFDNFQLDIVGFLAILGEGSVTANAQVASLSWLFYLPRLIPAPQALLWPTRPKTLPSEKAWVTGVYSGNHKDHVHHIASVLLDGDVKPNYSVRCVRVTRKETTHSISKLHGMLKGEPIRAERSGTRSLGPPSVPAAMTGPLAWVTLLGCALAITLFIVSIVYGDGMSLLATILLALLSTLVGFGNKWTLKLARASSNPQNGDVVIRYPSGTYLIVKCDEAVARELFFAPEEIDYSVKTEAVYRLISLIGTLFLMLGVIALANARLELQFAWAGAYIIVNAAQWIAAALPPRMHWDLTCYEVQKELLSTGHECENFTDALWKAVVFTQDTRWVRQNEAAPQGKVWEEWLQEALTNAKTAIREEQPFMNFVNPTLNEKKRKDCIWKVPVWNAKASWNQINEDFNREDSAHPVKVGAVESQEEGNGLR